MRHRPADTIRKRPADRRALFAGLPITAVVLGSRSSAMGALNLAPPAIDFVQRPNVIEMPV